MPSGRGPNRGKEGVVRNFPWLCALALVGCSSSSGPTTQMITDTGGTVKIGDGTAVAIPAGALASPTNISIAPASGAASPAGATTVGPAYLFGPEGTQFSEPVQVTLSYTPGQLPMGKSASDIVVYTAPANGSTFTALETNVVDSTHVSAPTTHFSIFVPGVPSGTDGGTGIDLSGAVADLSGADFAGCTHNEVMMNGACTVTASCAGHSYQLLCAANDLGQTTCTCGVDGTTTVTAFPAGQTCLSKVGGDYTWSHTCMFP
jgi:hypothetical protein